MEYTPLKEAKIDIKKYVQSLIIGPQGELFERLKNFNDMYNLKLKFKDNFSWNRGSYKTVKKAAQNMFVNMDYSGRTIMDSFKHINRVDYKMRGFTDRLRDINRDMSQLRWKGLRLMDSNVDAELLWEQFIEYVDVKIAMASKLFPTVVIHTGVEASDEQYNGFPGISFKMMIEFTENTTITCYDHRGKEVLDEIEIYPFTLFNTTNLFMAFNGWATYYEKTEDEKYKLIEASRRRISRFQSYHKNWRGRYYPNNGFLRHPFIGSPYDSVDNILSDNRWTNVCFGDFVSDINLTSDMLDFPSLLHIMEEWASTYHIGKTHPLQQPNLWRLGVPMNITIEQANIVGLDPDWCYKAQADSGTNINFLTACDDCQLNPNNMVEDDGRSTCEWYVSHQKVTNKDTLGTSYISEIASILCSWITDLIHKDRLIRNISHDTIDKQLLHDKLVILKPRIISMLIHPSSTNFKDLLRRGLNITTYHPHSYSYNTRNSIGETTNRDLGDIDSQIALCKREWKDKHHNQYDRLVNEIELWNKTFSKMIEKGQAKVEEEQTNSEKEKEAWHAMLKRTGQEINTPIGR
tara:strand:+ start:110 stop:1837 length:1728 start_codon:yes stop_codon:yes gene_type:complete